MKNLSKTVSHGTNATESWTEFTVTGRVFFFFFCYHLGSKFSDLERDRKRRPRSESKTFDSTCCAVSLFCCCCYLLIATKFQQNLVLGILTNTQPTAAGRSFFIAMCLLDKQYTRLCGSSIKYSSRHRKLRSRYKTILNWLQNKNELGF